MIVLIDKLVLFTFVNIIIVVMFSCWNANNQMVGTICKHAQMKLFVCNYSMFRVIKCQQALLDTLASLFAISIIDEL